MKRILIIIGIVILVIAGILIAKNHSDNSVPNSTATSGQTTNPASPVPESPNSSSPNPSTNNSIASSKEITYGSSGFSPSSLTVSSGDQVTVKNNSSSQIQFQSDPHPQHTDDPELNIGVIGPGQSKTITVTKKGSHGFHNHLNPSNTGTLVVQ